MGEESGFFHALPNRETPVFQASECFTALPVRDKSAPFSEPTKESIVERLTAAGITEEQVLKALLTEDEKKGVVLTIRNQGGSGFQLWLYDCWWCYNERPAGALLLQSAFTDIRVGEAQPVVEFKKFDSFKSTSGYFVLFVDYIEAGESRRQPIGVRNLFDPREQEIVLSVGPANGPRFKVEFVPAQGATP